MGLVLVIIAILNTIDYLIPFGAVAYMTSVLSSTSVVLFIAAASHLMRKIFFPQISMTEMANSAKNDPKAAAIVFFSMCGILASLIFVNASLLLK